MRMRRSEEHGFTGTLTHARCKYGADILHRAAGTVLISRMSWRESAPYGESDVSSWLVRIFYWCCVIALAFGGVLLVCPWVGWGDDLRAELLECSQERGQVVRDGLPHHCQVDGEVTVCEHVAHLPCCAKRHLRMRGGELRIALKHLVACLAEDLDVPDDRVLDEVALPECDFVRVGRVGLDSPHGIQHVADIVG